MYLGRNKKKGFSLIETFVAISVLLLAVTGVLTTTQQSLKAASVAKENLIATQLAQEAIEFVRNMRDEIAIKIIEDGGAGGIDWLHRGSLNLRSHCVEDGLCKLNIPNGTVGECGGGACGKIQYDDSTGEYGSGEDTIFTREVNIKKIETDQEAEVTVRVYWQAGLATKEVVLQETIYNWRL